MSSPSLNPLWCFALAGLAAPEIAVAQHSPVRLLPNEQSYYEGLPVVLSASRLYQPLNEAPAAVTVIDHDKIEAIGPRDLAELFRFVPGMAVGYDSAHNPVAAYHGIADQYARRMQVLVDGRSVYLPLWGGVLWNDLPLVVDDIDRIEVIRGPNAVAYGSSSYLGVISIITRHPSQDPGTTLRFVGGNNDIADGVARYAGGEGGLFYRLTAMYQQDEGLNADPDRRKVRKLTGRIDRDSSPDDTLMLQFGFDSGDMVQGFGGDENDPPHDVEASSGFVQLRWEHERDPEHSLAVQFFYDRHTWDEAYFTLPLDLANSIAGLPRGQIFVQPYLDKSFRSERYELEVERRDRWGRGLRSVVGGRVRRDRVDMGDFTAGLGRNAYDLQRLFGNLEWAPVQQLRLHSGVMMERNEFTGTHWLPRLALNWLVNRHHTLRASISKSTRTPVVVEELSNWVVHLDSPVAEADLLLLADDFDLRAETIVSRELGYHAEFAERGLSFDLRYFDDQLDDLIGAQAALDGPPEPRPSPRWICVQPSTSDCRAASDRAPR
jgi:iron complex outermembrane receptor protein